MFEIESGIKAPKLNVMHKRLLAKVKAAYEAYAEAYFKVYGVKPEPYVFEGGFVRIGCNPGVSLRRLGDMTKQLRFRRS